MILQSDNPIRMVRELKGAPLSIFIALGMVRQRVSQEWLAGATGYTDKPICHALKYLREVGLVDQTSSGWQLVKENAKQLPLAMQMEGEAKSEKSKEAQEAENSEDAAEVEETTEDSAEDRALVRTSLTENVRDIPTCEEQKPFAGRNNSDLLLTYLINDSNNNNINQVSKVINDESRKNSVLDPIIEENLETFRELGIKINRRTSNLARMKHISRDYIIGTVKNLKQGELLGLAIIRMEQGDEVAHPKKHKAGCGCHDCLSRYGEWER
jgi:hypothetical protein